MNKEPAIVETLINHEKYTFSLVGSRYLGIHDENSDWDLVVTYTPDVAAELENLGFSVIPCLGPSDGYDSSYVVCVVQQVIDGAKVQVSLEKNALWKRLIMQAMDKSPELAEFDRGLRSNPAARDQLWAALYELAGFTEDEEDGFDDEPRAVNGAPMSDDDIPF